MELTDSAGSVAQSYVYDSFGRIVFQTGSLENSFTYTGREFDSETGLYFYRKTDKSTLEVTTFTYDAENRLTELNNGGSISTYKYDGLGRRIEKNANGVISRYIYENIEPGADMLLLYDGSNNLKTRFTYNQGLDRLLSFEQNGQNYFIITDILGSVTEVVDSSGVVQESNVYESFGSIVFETGNIDNVVKYTGREFDSESGLYYYRNRYYDANMGRFISEDPMGFSSGTINFYNYVGNNPINFIDPLGLFGCDNTCLANCFKEAGRQLTRCRLFDGKRNSARGVTVGAFISFSIKIKTRFRIKFTSCIGERILQ